MIANDWEHRWQRKILTGRWARPVALCALTLTIGACGTDSYITPVDTTPTTQGLAETAQAAKADYLISPGDDLTVRLYYNPQLDEDLRVRPDGKISLSLVGEIQASGKSTAELSKDISKDYAVYLIKPDSTVILRRAATQRAFFGGEVVKPGPIDMNSGSETILQGLLASGGFTSDSDPNRVILVRRIPGKPDPIVMSINVKGAFEGTAPNQNIALQPDDIVYVPRSGVADVNLALRQYLWNNLNLSTNAGIEKTVQ